jgi:hypothetical protein
MVINGEVIRYIDVCLKMRENEKKKKQKQLRCDDNDKTLTIRMLDTCDQASTTTFS